jgi:hypothetical protein
MNKEKIISKSFTLFGNEWKVVYDKKRLDDLDLSGLCEFKNSTITLNKQPDELKDFENTTFIHELTHAILESMNEFELSANEKFIEIFSSLLYQYIKTANYGK